MLYVCVCVSDVASRPPVASTAIVNQRLAQPLFRLLPPRPIIAGDHSLFHFVLDRCAILRHLFREKELFRRLLLPTDQ